MGILGEIPYDQMLARLDTIAAEWRAADPLLGVQPALHLIVSVAQPLPGKDGMYRQRSDPDLIEKIYGFAKARGAITILDVQVGKSTLDSELPVLLPFLSRPDVHLGIDPEFFMHNNREGRVPGSRIGSMDAKDVELRDRSSRGARHEVQAPAKDPGDPSLHDEHAVARQSDQT